MRKVKTFMFPIDSGIKFDNVINEFIKDNNYSLINVSVSVDVWGYNLFYAVTYNDNEQKNKCEFLIDK